MSSRNNDNLSSKYKPVAPIILEVGLWFWVKIHSGRVLLNADRKPPGVGRGRGRGREDGSSTQAKGIGRGLNDSKVSGGGRGRGGPGGRGGGRGMSIIPFI